MCVDVYLDNRCLDSQGKLSVALGIPLVDLPLEPEYARGEIPRQPALPEYCLCGIDIRAAASRAGIDHEFDERNWCHRLTRRHSWTRAAVVAAIVVLWVLSAIAPILLSGCKAETVEWVGPHGMYRQGTVVFGTDQTHARTIPTPDGPITANSADRGSPESLQRVSNDVTSTVAVIGVVLGLPAIINAAMDGIGAINATSKAASVEKAAIGAGKAVPK